MNKGIPAMALSAATDEEDPTLIADLTVKLIASAYASIPPGYGLNVNFPKTTNGTTVDDYEFVTSKIGRNGLGGLLFSANLSDCTFASAQGLGFPYPGLCLGAPISAAGYLEDNDPTSEYNVFTQNPLQVSVSTIEGTYQAQGTFDIVLSSRNEILTDSPTTAPNEVTTTNAPTNVPATPSSGIAFSSSWFVIILSFIGYWNM